MTFPRFRPWPVEPGRAACHHAPMSAPTLPSDEPGNAFQGAKQLYRDVEELLDGLEDGDTGADLVSRFMDALQAQQGVLAGLVACAGYEERRARFQRLDGVGEAAPTFPSTLDPRHLGLSEEDSTAAWHGMTSLDWPEEIRGAPAPGSRFGACLVTAGRARYVLALEFEGDLSDVHVDLVLHALRSVLSSRLQKARWGSTMREAASIQRSLLPSRAPRFEGYEIAGVSHPAEEVGGDFYDALEIADDALALAIGDASGHGLPAALVARDVVVGLRMGMSRKMRIAPVLEKLNRIIHRGGPSSSFVSLFYGELEDNGNFFYVNCGHKDPLLFRCSEPGAPPLQLGTEGMVLGPVPDADFKRCHVHIDRGDCLVLYTDGVNERQDEQGEQFGDARIVETVRPVIDRPAREIVEAVVSAAAAFGDTTTWADDATVVVVKRLP